MSAAPSPDGLSDLYESVECYPWDDDVEFQSGLSAILGSNPSPELASELALRARCFYYARKYDINIDFDVYKAYRQARNRPPIVPHVINDDTANSADRLAATSLDPAGSILPGPASASEPAAPYPTSFAHIVDLITSGKPVPGIKDIPSTVLTGQGTQSAQAQRKKPWEKDTS